MSLRLFWKKWDLVYSILIISSTCLPCGIDPNLQNKCYMILTLLNKYTNTHPIKIQFWKCIDFSPLAEKRERERMGKRWKEENIFKIWFSKWRHILMDLYKVKTWFFFHFSAIDQTMNKKVTVVFTVIFYINVYNNSFIR